MTDPYHLAAKQTALNAGTLLPPHGFDPILWHQILAYLHRVRL